MTFNEWKAAVKADIKRIGFNKTYRKYGLSSAGLRNIVKGTAITGFRSWERLGRHIEADQLKDPE